MNVMTHNEMTLPSLIRWSGVALVLSGISLAAFMLIHPFGAVAGADVAARFTWIPSHTFHFLGALFALFGLVGLHLRQIHVTGKLGSIGFVLAFIGTAMFVGTGMITAFLWPVIARNAPDFVAADGPMFTDPLTIGTTAATYLFLVVGYVLFGIATARARVLPRVASWVVIVGVVLISVPVAPVGPVPWIVRVMGAVVFGVGLAWLGLALWSSATKTVNS